MQIVDYEDATTPVAVIVKPKHALHCKRRNPGECVGARAILSIPGAIAAHVYQNITYILWKDKKVPTRYFNSPEMRRLAAINDLKGRGGVIEDCRKEFKAFKEGIQLWLFVPVGCRSKDYLRSPAMRDTRRRSNKINKLYPKRIRRGYKKPGERGLRSGSGKVFIWNEETIA